MSEPITLTEPCHWPTVTSTAVVGKVLWRRQHHNHRRSHTALKGASPADRVPNIRGQYT